MALKTSLVFLFLSSLFSAIFWNEINKNHIRDASIPLRHNTTVITKDDISYLAPFDNFIQEKSLYRSEIQKYSSITRSPGYGFIYYLSCLIFSKNNALLGLYFFQVTLFALSVICLYYINHLLFNSNTLALLLSAIYGVLPFSIGFVNYTLTEGITPALLIFCIYFNLKGYFTNIEKTKFTNYFIGAILLSILLIIRPILGIFSCPLFLIFISDIKIKSGYTKPILISLFFILIVTSLFGIWQIRNRKLLGHWTNAHPIYQNEIPGIFRLPHKSAWEFFKGWETSGQHFHETIVPFWEKTMNLDTNVNVRNKVISRIPLNVIQIVGKKNLINAFLKYQQAIIDQKSYYDSNKIMPHTPLKSEIEASNQFLDLAQIYRNNDIYNYYVQTPTHIFKTMAFHSNLSLFIFQKTLRGNWFIELIRFICFILHSFLFVSIPLSLWFARKNKLLRPIVLTVLFYLSYLIFIQRGIEERYTLPILPVLIMISGIILYQLRNPKSNSLKNEISKTN